MPRTFKWRDFIENETTIVGRTDFGYIAEEVHEVFPELVGYGDFEDGDNFTSGLIQSSIAWDIAVLKPDTSSEASNIYSFQLHMDGTVDTDFEINDISIVFRVKPVK